MVAGCPFCGVTVLWDWDDLGASRTCPKCERVFAIEYIESYNPETEDIDEDMYGRKPNDYDDDPSGVWVQAW